MIVQINHDQCTGCGTCEIVCSLKHYGVINPRKARIKVLQNPVEGYFYPLVAGPYTDAACSYKNKIILHGREYDKCSFCNASCPDRPFFKEPDTGIPLKCDLCGDPPDPMCVKFCVRDALVLVDSEEPDNGEEEIAEPFKPVF